VRLKKQAKSLQLLLQQSTTFFFFRILYKWPNTYTLTKALAEDLVRSYSADLPIGVFRPAIGKYHYSLQLDQEC
jgi:hypothetical protein